MHVLHPRFKPTHVYIKRSWAARLAKTSVQDPVGAFTRSTAKGVTAFCKQSLPLEAIHRKHSLHFAPGMVLRGRGYLQNFVLWPFSSYWHLLLDQATLYKTNHISFISFVSHLSSIMEHKAANARFRHSLIQAQTISRPNSSCKMAASCAPRLCSGHAFLTGHL